MIYENTNSSATPYIFSVHFILFIPPSPWFEFIFIENARDLTQRNRLLKSLSMHLLVYAQTNSNEKQ